MNVVRREHVVGHITLVEIYVLPLSALCFMAGDGIGILYLKGIEMVVFAHCFHLFCLGIDVEIVVVDSGKELLLLLVGQRRRLRGEAVGDDGERRLVVVVVGETQHDIGEMQSIQFAVIPHTMHYSDITIRQECRDSVYRLIVLYTLGYLLFCPMVAVLHNHEPIARLQLLLTTENHIPYALIIYVCTLVGPCDDHGPVYAYLRVAAIQLLYQIITLDDMDIRKAGKAYLRQLGDIIICRMTVALYNMPESRLWRSTSLMSHSKTLMP